MKMIAKLTDFHGNVSYVTVSNGNVSHALANGIPYSLSSFAKDGDEMALKFALAECSTVDEVVATLRAHIGPHPVAANDKRKVEAFSPKSTLVDPSKPWGAVLDREAHDRAVDKLIGQSALADAPNDTVDALVQAESFIAGFEDDETQEGVADKLAGLRAAIARERAKPEAIDVLKRLLEWGRDNTSPRDANSPHALLVEAAAVVAKATAAPTRAEQETFIRADQALFDAADDMLAALHAVMRCARGELERPVTQRQPWGEAQRLVEAAIAKAEGQSNG